MNEELTVRLLGDSAAPRLPAVVWNEAEVMAALDGKLAAYQGRQYTEAEIKHAREDRAEVNRIEKQLAEAQKRVTDLYRQPVADFTAKVKLCREKTKQVSAAIDAQIKAVEQARRQEKREQFRQIYAGAAAGELAALIPFEKLLDERWLNASAAFGPARDELLTRIETCRAELETLRRTCGEDFPAVERAYLQSLSVREGLAEFQRLQDARAAQRRAEQARQAEAAAAAAAPIILRPTEEQQAIRAEGERRARANQAITADGRLDFSLQQFGRQDGGAQEDAAAGPPRAWYNFGAWLTGDDIAALREFFASRGIRYGKAKL